MRALTFLFTLLGLASLAYAEEAIPPSPIVKTELVIDAARIEKDQPFFAGVTFTLPPHWHIYWQNAGDSGIAPTLAWTLPEGLKAEAIHWPVPQAIEVGGLVNYGYEREVTLLAPVAPTRGDITGEMTVTAKWLVCRDICIPETATLRTMLPAQTADAPAVIEQTLAQLPQSAHPITAHYVIGDGKVTLAFNAIPGTGATTAARFFPAEDGIISNSAPQSLRVEGEHAITLTTARGSTEPLAILKGVLQVTRNGKTASYAVDALGDAAVAQAVAASAPPAAQTTGLLAALVLAFLGGLTLNIMPCVLPILALKALAVAKKANASRRVAALQGASYTGGVVLSFLLIASGMLALKASGQAIGWGFQLQNPWFVGALGGIMLLVAANLLGWFELPVLFGEKATGVDDSTLRGSFLTGVLAVLVATPCTAPFMATALGATLTLPAAQALLVFASLGVGMAAPFLLISLWPAARRLLPKPGAWMHRFKQLLALPMLATAAWLFWVLVQLLSPALVAEGAAWQPYSPAKLEALRKSGTPVLVDATASWCITCKINERVALKPEPMQRFFREQNVTLLVADWTQSDPDITAWLTSFGRNGVPLVVYYPPHAEPVVLPQILTPSVVRETIARP